MTDEEKQDEAETPVAEESTDGGAADDSDAGAENGNDESAGGV